MPAATPRHAIPPNKLLNNQCSPTVGRCACMLGGWSHPAMSNVKKAPCPTTTVMMNADPTQLWASIANNKTTEKAHITIYIIYTRINLCSACTPGCVRCWAGCSPEKHTAQKYNTHPQHKALQQAEGGRIGSTRCKSTRLNSRSPENSGSAILVSPRSQSDPPRGNHHSGTAWWSAPDRHARASRPTRNARTLRPHS